ncbi:uncharacterized protein LOC132631695 isoform X2 [Lycium barbarum]|uniref:uncharacterized protein LOC132631695 isoform X2 n=2 Tax=Lycium barbarum TaxID=112863 RepID=UPI00293E5176|nr:uncharacterized protein LOC132631695 isoform X2 [Lycium barbarum]
MGAENQSLKREFGEKGVEKIYVSENINGLQYTNTKSESFVVDMERISHLVEKDMNANSRITRNLSRKGLLKKTNFNAVNEKDTSLMATSPRASLLGASMPEKPMVVTAGTTDHSTLHTHNQNTTVAASNGAAATSGATAIDSKGVSQRFSFRRSASPSWTLDPRRILIFFATISSVGTILLIYFTLSMAKLNGEDKTSY